MEASATSVVEDSNVASTGDDNSGKHFPTLLTLRVIMHGREAGSIIGKRGENVKKFREETGARINISDATSPERIVTVTGSMEQIISTFRMVCCRFEEDLQQLNAALGGSEVSKHLVGLRLIMPAIQCGSVIGRNGAKIKEIRDTSGASVQISGDLLPNSTERLVTISGSVDAVIKAVEMICKVILECPIKGPVSQYRPKPTRPVSLVFPMQYETTHQQSQFQLPAMSFPQVFNAVPYPTLIASQQTIVALPYTALPPGAILQPMVSSCNFHQASSAQALTSGINHLPQQPTQILTIPNELIGCVIGRGGAKINEIRQQSGANIKISSSDDRTNERLVTITGTHEAVMTAIQLIEYSLENHKATMYNAGLRHSRSSSSLGISTVSHYHSNLNQSSQQQQTLTLTEMPSSEVIETMMSSPGSNAESTTTTTVNGRQPSAPPSRQASQAECSYRPMVPGLHGQPVNFQQQALISHQGLNSSQYLLPLAQVQPFFQPPAKIPRNQSESNNLATNSNGSCGVSSLHSSLGQNDNMQVLPSNPVLAASSHHPSQQVFNTNPNVYHVQSSAAIQIAFRPFNPLLAAGSLIDSQLLDASNGGLVILGPSNSNATNPEVSACLIDPTRMLGLKSKSSNGCGGYVLTTGSRSGFKFAPY